MKWIYFYENKLIYTEFLCKVVSKYYWFEFVENFADGACDFEISMKCFFKIEFGKIMGNFPFYLRFSPRSLSFHKISKIVFQL